VPQESGHTGPFGVLVKAHFGALERGMTSPIGSSEKSGTEKQAANSAVLREKWARSHFLFFFFSVQHQDGHPRAMGVARQGRSWQAMGWYVLTASACLAAGKWRRSNARPCFSMTRIALDGRWRKMSTRGEGPPPGSPGRAGENLRPRRPRRKFAKRAVDAAVKRKPAPRAPPSARAMRELSACGAVAPAGIAASGSIRERWVVAPIARTIRRRFTKLLAALKAADTIRSRMRNRLSNSFAMMRGPNGPRCHTLSPNGARCHIVPPENTRALVSL